MRSHMYFSLLFIVFCILFISGLAFQQKHDTYGNQGHIPQRAPEKQGEGVVDVVVATSSPIPTQQKTPITALHPASVSVLHFGDAMFDRGVRKRMEKGIDPFEGIRNINIMNDYDVRVLNLEGPIVSIDRSRCQQKAYNFQFPIETAALLNQEGFTHVTLANNHVYDCYSEGVSSTLRTLSEQGIQSFGFPKEQIFTTTQIGDRTITFVGYDNTIGAIPFADVQRAIVDKRTTSDLIIASVHFGNEYEPIAHPAQVHIAHQLIDLGVDAVIGHHPHVVQNWELYKGKPIFYSLGNFIFDQIGEKENFGFGVGITFANNTIDLMLYPYTIINSIPTPLSMQDANAWCKQYYGSIPYVNVSGCLATIEELAKNAH